MVREVLNRPMERPLLDLRSPKFGPSNSQLPEKLALDSISYIQKIRPCSSSLISVSSFPLLVMKIYIFFCRLWEFECAKYYIWTICTIGQIDHYGLYKVITFQIFDFVSKFWFSWRHGRTNTQLINGPSADQRTLPVRRNLINSTNVVRCRYWAIIIDNKFVP